jgi:hypothetical protein
MDLGVGADIFGPLAKCLQLFHFDRIGLDIVLFDWVIVCHEEEQDRSIEPLGFVELKLGDGKLATIAIGAVRGLAVFVADDADVGRGIPDHLERGIDQIDQLGRVVFHREVSKPFAFEGLDQHCAVQVEIFEGTRDHNAGEAARSKWVGRHCASL